METYESCHNWGALHILMSININCGLIHSSLYGNRYSPSPFTNSPRNGPTAVGPIAPSSQLNTPVTCPYVGPATSTTSGSFGELFMWYWQPLQQWSSLSSMTLWACWELADFGPWQFTSPQRCTWPTRRSNGSHPLGYASRCWHGSAWLCPLVLRLGLYRGWCNMWCPTSPSIPNIRGLGNYI